MKLEENKIKEKLFQDGLNCFNKGRFYDAHEFWEDLWSEIFQRSRPLSPAFCRQIRHISLG